MKISVKFYVLSTILFSIVGNSHSTNQNSINIQENNSVINNNTQTNNNTLAQNTQNDNTLQNNIIIQNDDKIQQFFNLNPENQKIYLHNLTPNEAETFFNKWFALSWDNQRHYLNNLTPYIAEIYFNKGEDHIKKIIDKVHFLLLKAYNKIFQLDYEYDEKILKTEIQKIQDNKNYIIIDRNCTDILNKYAIKNNQKKYKVSQKIETADFLMCMRTVLNEIYKIYNGIDINNDDINKKFTKVCNTIDEYTRAIKIFLTNIVDIYNNVGFNLEKLEIGKLDEPETYSTCERDEIIMYKICSNNISNIYENLSKHYYYNNILEEYIPYLYRMLKTIPEFSINYNEHENFENTDYIKLIKNFTTLHFAISYKINIIIFSYANNKKLRNNSTKDDVLDSIKSDDFRTKYSRFFSNMMMKLRFIERIYHSNISNPTITIWGIHSFISNNYNNYSDLYDRYKKFSNPTFSNTLTEKFKEQKLCNNIIKNYIKFLIEDLKPNHYSIIPSGYWPRINKIMRNLCKEISNLIHA